MENFFSLSRLLSTAFHFFFHYKIYFLLKQDWAYFLKYTDFFRPFFFLFAFQEAITVKSLETQDPLGGSILKTKINKGEKWKGVKQAIICNRKNY